MKKIGTHQWQKSESKKAEMKIRQALLDGNPHLYGDLLKETGLSRATLSKHLKDMEKKKMVLREMDTSCKYPYPVSYLLLEDADTDDVKEIKKHLMSLLGKAETNLRETKEPRGFFDLMNTVTEMLLLQAVETLRSLEKTEKEPPEKLASEIDLWVNLTVFWSFEKFAKRFLQLTEELSSEIDTSTWIESWKKDTGTWLSG